MANKVHTTVVQADGSPKSGVTNLKLYYGSNPLNGAPSDTLIGTFTEDSTGSYSINLPTTYGETNQYTIKLEGTPVDEYTNVFIAGSDIASTTRLGKTGLTDAGALLVGVYDSAAKYTATTVQGIIDELAGARLASETNSNIKWLYDGVNALNTLVAGTIAADFVKLHAITASAADLNKMTGFSSVGAGFTAANLTTLTTGASSDSSALHTHKNVILGTSAGATGTLSTPDSSSGNSHLHIAPGKNTSTLQVSNVYIDLGTSTGGTNGGNVYIDTVATAGGVSGGVYIKEATAEGNVNYKLIGTEWALGDLDFSNGSFLSLIPPYSGTSGVRGIVTRALRELDIKLAYIYQQVTGSTTVTFSDVAVLGVAKSPTGTVSADITVQTWDVGVTEYIFWRTNLAIVSDNVRKLTVRLYAKQNTSGSTLISIKAAGTTIGTITVSSTSAAWYSVTYTFDPTAPSTTDQQEITISAKAASNTCSIYENIQFVVTH